MMLSFFILCLINFAFAGDWRRLHWLVSEPKLVPPHKNSNVARVLVWFRDFSAVDGCVKVFINGKATDNWTWKPLLQDAATVQTLLPSTRTAKSMLALFEPTNAAATLSLKPMFENDVTFEIRTICRKPGTGSEKGNWLLRRLTSIARPEQPLRFMHASCNIATMGQPGSPAIQAMLRQHQEKPFEFGLMTGDWIYLSGKYIGTAAADAGVWRTSSVNTFADPNKYASAEWRTLAMRTGRHLFQQNHIQTSKWTASMPIYGTWDDHDAGYNNIETSTPVAKKIVQDSMKLFRMFFPNILTAAQTKQAAASGTGDLFHTFWRGGVMFIVTDCVTHSSSSAKSVYGKAQVDAIAALIKMERPKLVVLVSGINIMRQYGSTSRSVASDAPSELTKLLALFDEIADTTRVLILSGDIHRSVFVHNPQHPNVAEFVASGLATTHGNVEIYCSSSSQHKPNDRGLQWNFGGRMFGTVEIDRKTFAVTMSAFNPDNVPYVTTVWQPNQPPRHRILRCCTGQTYASLLSNSTGFLLEATTPAQCAAAVTGSASSFDAVSHVDKSLPPARVEAVLREKDNSVTYFGDGLVCDKDGTRLRSLENAPEWADLHSILRGVPLEAIVRVDDTRVIVFAGGLLLPLVLTNGVYKQFDTRRLLPLTDIEDWSPDWTNVDAAMFATHGDGTDIDDERLYLFSNINQYTRLQNVKLGSDSLYGSEVRARMRPEKTAYPYTTTSYWDDGNDDFPFDVTKLVGAARRTATGGNARFFLSDGNVFERDGTKPAKYLPVKRYSPCGNKKVRALQRVSKSGWRLQPVQFEADSGANPTTAAPTTAAPTTAAPTTLATTASTKRGITLYEQTTLQVSDFTRKTLPTPRPQEKTSATTVRVTSTGAATTDPMEEASITGAVVTGGMRQTLSIAIFIASIALASI